MRAFKNYCVRGFTLVELLVVIAIIAILFAVVLVAINPAQRFKDSRNSRRLSDVKSIVEAVTTYTADRRGAQLPDVPDYQCVGSKPATVVSDTSPIPRAHWKLDSPDQTVDSSGNNFSATITGFTNVSAKLSEGIQNQDPLGGASVANSIGNPTDALTLEGWMRLNQKIDPGSFDHHQALFDKGNYRLQLNSDSGKLEWEAENSAPSSWGAPYSITLGDDTDGDGLIDADDLDDDNDSKGLLNAGGQPRFSDSIETFVGINDKINCGADAWPPDFNNDQVINVSDVVSVASRVGGVYSARHDLNADGVVNADDISIVNIYYNKDCIVYGIKGVNVVTQFQNTLYAGTVTTGGAGRILKKNGDVWTGIPGYSSLATSVNALETYNGKLYAGHSSSDNKARIYSYDGTTWEDTMLGGLTIPNGDILALKRYREKLYAGISDAISGASVWEYDGISWRPAKQFGTAETFAIYSLAVFNGKLYAGTGRSADPPNDQSARVFEFNGTSWVERFIPSDLGNKDAVYSLVEYEKNLIIGLGGNNSATDGAVDKWPGSGGVVSVGTIDKPMVMSLSIFNGTLYAGLSGSTGVGEIKYWDGSSWISSLVTNTEEVRSLYPFQGKLYAATRGDAITDATIRSYGNNGYIGSQKTKWQPNVWYHIAGVYNGGNTQMKLIINGSVDSMQSGAPSTIAANTNLLYLGIGYGSDAFSGVIDDFAVHHSVLSDTIASHAGCYNLGQYLAPEYMGSLPIDPSSTVTDGTDTGYFISKDTGGVITITAPLTETTSSVPEIIKASR